MEISERTIALCSQDGTPLRVFNHPTYSIDNLGYNTTSTGTGAVFSIQVIKNKYVVTQTGVPSGYSIGDEFIIEATILGGSGLNDLTITAVSADLTKLSVSGTPFGYYNAMRFDIPTIQNLVYVDWLRNAGLTFLNNNGLCRIDEFVSPGVTNTGIPYWKNMAKDTDNSTMPHESVKKYEPKTYKSLTVSFFEPDGTPIIQSTSWILELVLYSKV